MSDATPGKRLQRLRKAAGMSQAHLAEAANVPIGTLRNWEQDRRTPLLDTAARVANALGVSVAAFVEAPPPPSPTASEGGMAGGKPSGQKKRPGGKQVGKKGGTAG